MGIVQTTPSGKSVLYLSLLVNGEEKKGIIRLSGFTKRPGRKCSAWEFHHVALSSVAAHGFILVFIRI